jgi:hypothetical protein
VERGAAATDPLMFVGVCGVPVAVPLVAGQAAAIDSLTALRVE